MQGIKRYLFFILSLFLVCQCNGQVYKILARPTKNKIKFQTPVSANPFPTQAILIWQGGQSNDVSRATSDPSHRITPGVQVFEYRPDTDTLKNLADPTGYSYSAATAESMNPMLLSQLHALTGLPVIVVCTAEGNTGIDVWINPANTEFINMKNYWNKLLAFCTRHSISIQGKYGVWLQGENDAVDSMAVDTYLSKLNTLVDTLTLNFGMSNVFGIRVGYNNVAGEPVNDSVHSETIMTAQRRLNYSKDEYIVSTDTASRLTGAQKISANEVHYTLLGQNAVGYDLAHAIYTWRSTGKKTTLVEPVPRLKPVAGYFDYTWDFRLPNQNLTELWNRNNLLNVSGSSVFNGKHGMTIHSAYVDSSATTVTLTNAHDWSIEFTGQMDTVAQVMLMNGDDGSGAYSNDWFWINSSNTIQMKGGGQVLNLTCPDANFNTLTNVVITYTTSGNSLKVYVNGTLENTYTSWAFTSMKLQTFFRGYTATPTYPFNGVAERIRVVKKALLPYEFDRSPNITSPPVINWLFTFNNTINENSSSVSSTYKNFNNTSGTPSYDGTPGIVFTRSAAFMLIGQTFSASTFTVQFDAKFPAMGSGSVYQIMTGPTSTPNNQSDNSKCILIQSDASTYGWFQWNGLTWILGPSVTWSSIHTYKLHQAGGSVSLYVDGVLNATKSSTAPMIINTIGAGYTTAATNINGTMANFSIKNF